MILELMDVTFNPEGVSETCKDISSLRDLKTYFAVFRILPSLRDWLYGDNPYQVYC